MNSFLTRNPFTLEPLGEWALESPECLSRKASAASAAFGNWSREPVAARVEHIRQALHLFDTDRHVLAREISLHTGQPLRQSVGEIDAFFRHAHRLCAIAEASIREESGSFEDGARFFKRQGAMGVVLAMVGWSNPLLNAADAVLPALLDGNTVLLKQSRLAPSIGERFERVFSRMGGHEALLSHIVVSRETMLEGIAKGLVDHMIFSGSRDGARAILGASIGHLVGCEVRLWTPGVAYASSDMDLETTAADVVRGALMNAGQSNGNISTLYVDAVCYPQMLKRCRDHMATYSPGDPLDLNSSLGPLTVPECSSDLEALIADAVRREAVIEFGGKTETFGRGTFFQPTLISRCNPEFPLARRTCPGPVLAVIPVADAEVARRSLIRNKSALVTLYAGDVEKAIRLVKQLPARQVQINQWGPLDQFFPTGRMHHAAQAAEERWLVINQSIQPTLTRC